MSVLLNCCPCGCRLLLSNQYLGELFAAWYRAAWRAMPSNLQPFITRSLNSTGAASSAVVGQSSARDVLCWEVVKQAVDQTNSVQPSRLADRRSPSTSSEMPPPHSPSQSTGTGTPELQPDAVADGAELSDHGSNSCSAGSQPNDQPPELPPNPPMPVAGNGVSKASGSAGTEGSSLANGASSTSSLLITADCDAADQAAAGMQGPLLAIPGRNSVLPLHLGYADVKWKDAKHVIVTSIKALEGALHHLNMMPTRLE